MQEVKKQSQISTASVSDSAGIELEHSGQQPQRPQPVLKIITGAITAGVGLSIDGDLFSMATFLVGLTLTGIGFLEIQEGRSDSERGPKPPKR